MALFDDMKQKGKIYEDKAKDEMNKFENRGKDANQQDQQTNQTPTTDQPTEQQV